MHRFVDMIQYMYADYTSFEINRNFFEVLKAFTSATVDTVIQERQILLLRENREQKKREYALTLERLDTFQKEILQVTSSLQKDGEDLPILRECSEKTDKFIEELVEEQRINISTDYNQKVLDIERSIGEAQSKAGVSLERFFLLNPLQIRSMILTICARSKESYDAEFELHSDGGIEYKVSLQCNQTSFWQRERKVSDLAVGDVLVPVRLKKRILSRDYQAETVKLNDFYITKYRLLEEGKAELSLSKELAEESEKVEILYSPDEQGNVLALFHIPEAGKREDILASKEIAQNLDLDCLLALKSKLERKVIEVKTATQTLKTVIFESEDVVQKANFSSLARRVAELYSPVIQEIIRRGSRTGELTLRLEEEGKRTEIYYSMEEIMKSLTGLGEFGQEIASTLGVSSAQA